MAAAGTLNASGCSWDRIPDIVGIVLNGVGTESLTDVAPVADAVCLGPSRSMVWDVSASGAALVLSLVLVRSFVRIFLLVAALILCAGDCAWEGSLSLTWSPEQCQCLHLHTNQCNPPTGFQMSRIRGGPLLHLGYTVRLTVSSQSE
jgi:hypothetical protein